MAWSPLDDPVDGDVFGLSVGTNDSSATGSDSSGTLEFDTGALEQDDDNGGPSDNDGTSGTDHSYSSGDKGDSSGSESSSDAGATTKPRLAATSLEDLLCIAREQRGRPLDGVAEAAASAASSTVGHWARSLRHWRDYCIAHDHDWLEATANQKVLFDYAKHVCSTTTGSRPGGTLSLFRSAMKLLCEVCEMPCPFESAFAMRALAGIVKANTRSAATPRAIFEVDKVLDQIAGQAELDEEATDTQLRERALVLLMCYVPARPADIAGLDCGDVVVVLSDGRKWSLEKALRVAEQSDTVLKQVDHVALRCRWTKTDRAGSLLIEKLLHSLPPDNSRIDGVRALLEYAARAHGQAAAETDESLSSHAAFAPRALFRSCAGRDEASPTTHLAPATVSGVLKRFLTSAGIGGPGLSGGSFRPSTTTFLLGVGMPTETVRQQGGWASSTTMERFYARAQLHKTSSQTARVLRAHTATWAQEGNKRSCTDSAAPLSARRKRPLQATSSLSDDDDDDGDMASAENNAREDEGHWDDNDDDDDHEGDNV